MNQDKLLVSVIMPVYNAEKYLREALDSMLRQTYDNFELIIVDDGSTDSSGEIVDEYAARDKRIRVFHQLNTGVVGAANFGASHANGEYIMRTDSDDVSFDTKLADLTNTASRYPSAVVISGNIEVIDSRGEYLYRQLLPPKSSDIKRSMYIYNPLANGATMIRRDAFESVGGYSEVFAEDFHLWTKLYDKGDFIGTGTALYRWRINPEGLTISNNSLSISKEKEYTKTIWEKALPEYLSRRSVVARAQHYCRSYGSQGPEYKKVFLYDLARLSVHLIKRGKSIQGSKQLLVIASTGRIGLKTVLKRLYYAGKGVTLKERGAGV